MSKTWDSGVNIGDKGGVREKLRRGTDGRRARVSVEVERPAE